MPARRPTWARSVSLVQIICERQIRGGCGHDWMRPAGRYLIESKRPRAQAELRAARTGVAARDAAVGARLSQCEANSTVLQVRLTNPAPHAPISQRINIAPTRQRSVGSARGGGRPGGGRGPGEHAAAAGGEPLPGRGARGSPALPRRSPAFSPHPVMAYPRASAVLPFRRPTISMSPFRALILCLHPRRSFVHTVRPLLRAAPRVLRRQLNQPRSHPCA